jgi:hypothetical protein
VRDCCRANDEEIRKIKLEMQDLEGEHDDLVDLINSKLKDLEQLKSISSHI